MRDGYSLCTLPPMEKCAVCGKQGEASAIPRCSRCKMIRYCSRACQSTDWPRHKAACKAAAGASGGAGELSPSLLACLSLSWYRLVGLVVKASASRAEGPGFESRLRGIFSGSSHTSDLKIGTPVATLPFAWRYRVSTGTGRPGVSIL